MSQLVGISGSLRQQSFNTALLHCAADLLPEGNALAVATLHGIALYDGDLEATEGIPAAVNALKDKLSACDGIVIATPEYNGSMPGVLKNALDWLSRPSGDIARVFANKPVAVIGASPSGFGTVLAQAAWLPVLKALGTELWAGGALRVARAHTLFNAQGQLTDEPTREQLRTFMAGFCEFTQRTRRP